MTINRAEPESLSSSSLQPITQLLRSLSEPSRLEILNHLRLGEHRVVELTAHLGLAQSTTSAHLAVLREAGLVSSRSAGRSSVFSLNGEPELIDLMLAAQRLLAAATAGPRTKPPSKRMLATA